MRKRVIPLLRITKPTKWAPSVSYEDYVRNHPSRRISLPYVRCLEGKERRSFRMVRP